jgi:predicted MPP superfamily phosphohydrolase
MSFPKMPIFSLIVALFVLGGCAKGVRFMYQTDKEISSRMTMPYADYPATRFVVISDIHYFDPELGTSGSAFQDYINQDRKLIAESEKILLEQIKAINGIDAEFVLIAGDLTKDGELSSHTKFAEHIKSLVDSGKKVYVVPGNHDINVGTAHGYDGDNIIEVETVTPEDFARIYDGFGFDDAIYRDPNSLTYIAEPVDGLWLFAMDACLYRDNLPGKHPVTGAEFLPETLEWIENMLIKARLENKAVIGLIHHGVLEHYRGQADFDSEYLVNNYQDISGMFAYYGMRMVFTGHFHAQNISLKEWKTRDSEKFLFDIQTGSTVSTTHYRVVEITDAQEAVINSYLIESIPSRPDDFQEYAYNYIVDGVSLIAKGVLEGYKVKSPDLERLANLVGIIYAMNFYGDENPPDNLIDKRGLRLRSRIILNAYSKKLKGMINNIPPADNDVILNLLDGSWRE